MTSIPQFYSNYTFPTDFVEFPSSAAATCINANSNSVIETNTMWSQDSSFVPMIDNGALDHIVSLDFDTLASAWLPAYSSEQPANMSDMVVPAISDGKIGFYGGGVAGFQNFGGGFQLPCIDEFGEECSLVEDIKPSAFPSSAATENWGIQGNHISSAAEEPNIKVGRYSEEERKERILRYLKKRNQRNFNKTIKYACRKTLADRRVRVRGRFARNNIELCEEEMAMKKNQNTHKEDLYDSDSIQFQLKNIDEEDWLHEAMESLVCLSQSSPDDM